MHLTSFEVDGKKFHVFDDETWQYLQHDSLYETSKLYDESRHLLPVCNVPLKAGQLVGLIRSTRLESPETAYPLDGEEDYWIFHRIGVVREDYEGLCPVKVFISTEKATSGGENAFYVKIRPEMWEIIHRDDTKTE